MIVWLYLSLFLFLLQGPATNGQMQSTPHRSQGSDQPINTLGRGYKNHRCRLDLRFDHSLMRPEVGSIVDIIISLRKLNNTLRRADIDKDGVEDNLGLDVHEISYDLRLDNANEDFDQFFKACSHLQRKEDVCLVICLTTKMKGKWKSGGRICSSGSEPYKNSIAFSVHSDIGPSSYLYIEKVLMYSLGNAFGACDPYDNLMFTPNHRAQEIINAQNQRKNWNFKLDSIFFALCGRKKILKMLTSNASSCLIPNPQSHCGNGVLEPGEQCDSRKDQPCCTDRCTFVRAEDHVVCRSPVSECLKPAVCSGISGECPPAEAVKDGTPCNSKTQTCRAGFCNSTVCLDQNMANCQCNVSCLICCRQDNECLPSGIYGLSSHTSYLPEGNPCDNGEGFCNGKGECILTTSLQMVPVLVVFWTFIFYFAFVFFFLACLSYLLLKKV